MPNKCVASRSKSGCLTANYNYSNFALTLDSPELVKFVIDLTGSQQKILFA